MADPFTFEMPWPPSVNRHYQPKWDYGRGHVTTMLSDVAHSYRQDAVLLIRGQRGVLRRLAQPVGVRIVAIQPADGRLCDLDNLLKGTLDCIVRAGVLADDKYVDDLRITRGPREGRGRLVVTITVLGEG